MAASAYPQKDKLWRWLKARCLKATGWKQELINRVIKAKEDGTETIKERETREKKVEKLELLKNCAVHLTIFQILKLWTTGQTISQNCHRLDIKKSSTTWFMDHANSSKGKIWNALNNWKHSNVLRTGTCKRLIEDLIKRLKFCTCKRLIEDLISEKSSYCFMKAAVLPSMRQDRVYRTWISVVKETCS